MEVEPTRTAARDERIRRVLDRSTWMRGQALDDFDALVAENTRLRDELRHAENELRKYATGVQLISLRHRIRDCLVEEPS